jgi:hypothetical protein
MVGHEPISPSLETRFADLLSDLKGDPAQRAKAEGQAREFIDILVPKQFDAALQLIRGVRRNHKELADALADQAYAIIDSQFDSIGVSADRTAPRVSSNRPAEPTRRVPNFARKDSKVLLREKAIFEHLARSISGSVSGDELVEAAQSANKDATRQQIMTMIGKLVKSGWIESAAGSYSSAGPDTDAYLDALVRTAQLRGLETEL